MIIQFNTPKDDSFFKNFSFDTYTQTDLKTCKNSKFDIKSIISCILNQDIKSLSPSKKNSSVYKVQTASKTLTIKLEPIKYSELKTCLQAYEKIKVLQLNSILSKSFEYTYINNTWVLATICETSYDYTLEDIVNKLSSHPESCFPIEYLIQVFVNCFLAYRDLQNHGVFIQDIDLSCICFKVNKQNPDRINVFLLLDLINSKFLLHCAKVHFSSIELETFDRNFLYSLGKVIYLTLLMQGTESNIHGNFEELPFVPGLSKILHRLFNDHLWLHEKDFLFSKLLKTWEFLIKDTKPPLNSSMTGLYSAFFFTSNDIKEKALNFLTKNIENSSRYSKIFSQHSVRSKFFNYLSTLPRLGLEIGQFLLTQISKNKSNDRTKDLETLISLSYLLSKVEYNSLDNSIQSDISKGILILSQSKTLTILNLFYNGKLLRTLMSKDSNELRYLLKLTPYIGPSAIGELSNQYHDNNIDLLELIEHVPIHFKLKNVFLIADMINSVLGEIDYDDKNLNLPLYRAFKVIYELLSAAKMAKDANFQGICYRNTHNYNVAPVMAECLKCKKIFCVVCGHEHEKLHEISYLTYFAIKDQACSNNFSYLNSDLNFQKCFPIFEDFELLRKLENRNLVFYEGIKGENDQEGKIFLDQFDVDEMAYYTEFYFEELYTENFDIEIVGSGVVVKNLKEEIVKNGVSAGKFPRIGCFDTVGVGVFAKGIIFFTYNGFNLRKFVDFSGDSLLIRIVFKEITNISEKSRVTRVKKDDFLYIGACFDYLDKRFASRYLKIVRHFCLKFKKFKGKSLQTKANIMDVILHIKGLFNEKDIMEIFNPDDKKKKSFFKNCEIF